MDTRISAINYRKNLQTNIQPSRLYSLFADRGFRDVLSILARHLTVEDTPQAYACYTLVTPIAKLESLRVAATLDWLREQSTPEHIIQSITVICDVLMDKDPGARLRGADLSGAIGSGVNFKFADLQFASLQHSIFMESDFTHADLRFADLGEANLEGAQLAFSSLLNTNMRKTSLSQCKRRLTFTSIADVGESTESAVKTRRL
jgi:hypothetical protein